LEDLGGVGFTVRVDGAQRRIPQNDVAMIDFAGTSMSDADWAKVPDGGVILKSGEAIKGQLADIGGSSPLRLTIRTASGDRDISSSEVSHIALARPSMGVGTSGTNPNLQAPTGNGITVSAKQPWTATGLTVRQGEVLSINATGEVQLSTDSNDVATPFGSKSGRKATNAPLPNAAAGALIGRIGANGPAFGIGSGVNVPMPAAGQLFLGVNDDGFEDNQGEFRVDIARTNRR
jgi:hypothetical protein